MGDKLVEFRVETLIQMISLYTNQVQAYESQNATFVMACVAFLGVLLGVVLGIVGFVKGEPEPIKKLKYQLVSYIFLLIPAATAMVIYFLSLNMQKVAMSSGYLCYLEDELNKILEMQDLLYDLHLVGIYMGPRFLTNQYGPYVLIAFLAIIVICSAWASIYFARQATDKRPTLRYWIVLGVVLLACAVSCGISMIDLMNNGSVRWEIYQESQQLASGGISGP